MSSVGGGVGSRSVFYSRRINRVRLRLCQTILVERSTTQSARLLQVWSWAQEPLVSTSKRERERRSCMLYPIDETKLDEEVAYHILVDDY